MMPSILINFPCSSWFHYNRFTVMCQEKHTNFRYLHMDFTVPNRKFITEDSKLSLFSSNNISDKGHWEEWTARITVIFL